MFGKSKEPQIGNGWLPVKLGWRTRRLYGGPYHHKPEGFIGVKMAAEIDEDCEISIPTHDYQTPNTARLLVGISQTLQYLARGEKVYVGCMGGQGRTGLFMAALAKALGEKHPIEFVREHYFKRAVETVQQEIFIGELDVRSLQGPLARARKLSSRNWYKGLFSF